MTNNFVRLVVLVARRDYRRTVRRRGFVAGTLLLPLAMGLIFGISTLASTSVSQGGTSGPVIVVNQSAVPVTADPRLTPDVVVVDQATADKRLADRQIPDYFIVPATWP